jgi:hypothetical protein
VYRQIALKLANIEFHENPSSDSGIVNVLADEEAVT